MSEITYLSNFGEEAGRWIGQRVVALQEQRLRAGDPVLISLCGGSTPSPVYSVLASYPGIDWAKVVLTFGDERCVSPEDQASNFRMIQSALIEPSGVPLENVHRIYGELEPAEAARSYDATLRSLAEARANSKLRHDIFLLGLGEDGHTASLFPGSTALDESERWAVENYVGKFQSYRITMTYPVINSSAEVVFLINGVSKLPVMERVRAGSADPASRVVPEFGTVTWLVGQ